MRYLSGFPMFVFVAAMSAQSMFAQTKTPTEQLHADILATYNFQPRTLNQEEIAKKSKVLDGFWTKVQSTPKENVPLLRNELKNFSNSPYFLYDGSMLLLAMSKTDIDKSIALNAIAHSDLRDLQATEFLRTVHGMAKDGLNTTDAAFLILSEPKFIAFIPQHALTLGQNYSLIYMLLPTNEGYYLQASIQRLKTEKDETAQKSLLLLLWYTVTAEGDRAISSFIADVSKPKSVRDYASELRERNLNVSKVLNFSFSSYTNLKAERKARMGSISDEALMDFESQTAKIRAAFDPDRSK